VEGFLEELVVRRELADNYCHYCPGGWPAETLGSRAPLEGAWEGVLGVGAGCVARAPGLRLAPAAQTGAALGPRQAHAAHHPNCALTFGRHYRFGPADSYDSLDACYDWARDTLRAHAGDKREFVYSRDQLEAGQTHDELWNAAQWEMVRGRGCAAALLAPS
jgi:hypothetical protein